MSRIRTRFPKTTFKLIMNQNFIGNVIYMYKKKQYGTISILLIVYSID
jgi:hypothetical protein